MVRRSGRLHHERRPAVVRPLSRCLRVRFPRAEGLSSRCLGAGRGATRRAGDRRARGRRSGSSRRRTGWREAAVQLFAGPLPRRRRLVQMPRLEGRDARTTGRRRGELEDGSCRPPAPRCCRAGGVPLPAGPLTSGCLRAGGTTVARSTPRAGSTAAHCRGASSLGWGRCPDTPAPGGEVGPDVCGRARRDLGSATATRRDDRIVRPRAPRGCRERSGCLRVR